MGIQTKREKCVQKKQLSLDLDTERLKRWGDVICLQSVHWIKNVFNNLAHRRRGTRTDLKKVWQPIHLTVLPVLRVEVLRNEAQHPSVHRRHIHKTAFLRLWKDVECAIFRLYFPFHFLFRSRVLRVCSIQRDVNLSGGGLGGWQQNVSSMLFYVYEAIMIIVTCSISTILWCL